MVVRQVKVGAGRHHPCDRARNLYRALETPSLTEALKDERVIWTDVVESAVVIGINESNDPSRKIPPETQIGVEASVGAGESGSDQVG
ncbi:UNVERIFIED_CONTAM: hypothetical protein K2H54_060159 [Gekko kuhli]